MDTIDRLIRDVVGIRGEHVAERRRVVAEGYVNQLLAAERESGAKIVEREIPHLEHMAKMVDHSGGDSGFYHQMIERRQQDAAEIREGQKCDSEGVKTMDAVSLGKLTEEFVDNWHPAGKKSWPLVAPTPLSPEQVKHLRGKFWKDLQFLLDNVAQFTASKGDSGKA